MLIRNILIKYILIFQLFLFPVLRGEVPKIKVDEKSLPQIVPLVITIGNIFSPSANTGCTLPRRVSQKLREDSENGRPWTPTYVAAYLKDMPDSCLYMPKSNLSHLLHKVTIIPTQGKTRDWVVKQSPTYKNLSVETFISPSQSSFFYSLDCSGYLNATLEGSVVIPAAADIKSSAQLAMKSSSSMFVAGGVILSPLLAAYYGEAVGISLEKETRLKILKAMAEIPFTQDSDTLDMELSYDVIWSSNSGTSSFNGGGDIKASGGISVGVGSLSSVAETGASVKRESSFTNYSTYIINQRPSEKPQNITVKQIKDLIVGLNSK
ncbi:MAG: hypothetical protein WC756_06770 [Taibaiella sp.]